jgi:ubiquitin-protein ligase
MQLAKQFVLPKYKSFIYAMQNELKDWLQNPPEGCRLLQFEPLTIWIVEIMGPDTPLYRNQVYRLRVAFTDR